MNGVCDNELAVPRARSRADRFDAFVREHQRALVRYASLLAGSPAQGEDLVQDVLIRLYPRWDDLDEPLPYVRRSITNEFLSWRRRWSTRHIHLAGEMPLDRPVEAQWDTGPDPDLWAALLTLAPKQRAAIVLRFYEDLDDPEIAVLLQCRPGTVRSHISRGLSALRDVVTETEKGNRP